MRGRTRTNKGPNPLTRSFESNGPDVKIRGTAQHIADKYAQLARDATVSGDPVSAENYLQHAEHYYRMIAAAQEQYRQQYGTPQRPFDEDGEEGDEEGGPPNGYGYPAERGQHPMSAEEYADLPAQTFEGRPGGGERPQQQPRYDRNDRQDRGGQDRAQDRGQDRNQRFDRGDRFNGQGSGNQGVNGQGGGNQGGDRYERNGGGQGGPDRADRNGSQSGPDRNDRNGGQGYDRNASGPGERYDRQDRRDQRPPARGESGARREFPRNDRQPNQGRPEQSRFGNQADEARDAPEAALPAFLTNPVRPPITASEENRVEPPPVSSYPDEEGPAIEADVAPKPRRRRTRRPEAESLDFSAEPDMGDKLPE